MNIMIVVLLLGLSVAVGGCIGGDYVLYQAGKQLFRPGYEPYFVYPPGGGEPYIAMDCRLPGAFDRARQKALPVRKETGRWPEVRCLPGTEPATVNPGSAK